MKIGGDKLCGNVARLGVDRQTFVQIVHGQLKLKHSSNYLDIGERIILNVSWKKKFENDDCIYLA